MKVILEDWWRYLKDFLLSVLVAVPFASALYSALDVNLSSYFPREEIAQKTYTGIRVLRCCPHAAALGATIPLCVLYLLFFGVQAGYFLSAFRSYLPDGFTFAEYARRGFFELCIVSVINLAVILLAVFFCRRSENGKGGVLRGIAGLYAALNLDKNLHVLLLSKRELSLSNSNLAQGGIAAVFDTVHDSVQKHINDTLVAGGFRNNVGADCYCHKQDGALRLILWTYASALLCHSFYAVSGIRISVFASLCRSAPFLRGSLHPGISFRLSSLILYGRCGYAYRQIQCKPLSCRPDGRA